MTEPNTDIMAVCDRFLCKFNCAKKQHFCTADCIHIDHSGKCTTFEIDAEARKKLKAELIAEKRGGMNEIPETDSDRESARTP